MHPTLVLASALLTLVTAQNTEVPLFLVGFDSQPLVASILGSDATATTYAVSCSPGTSSEDCGVPGDLTVTEGPSTVAYTMELDPVTVSIGCKLGGTTSASCVATQNGVSVASDSIITTELQQSEITFIPVTILPSGAVASTTGASATATGASASASPSAASPTPTATGASATATGASASQLSSLVTAVVGASTGASAATNSVASTPSTAGMPRITGKAGYVLGGAVAAAGMVLGGL